MDRVKGWSSGTALATASWPSTALAASTTCAGESRMDIDAISSATSLA
ncbi:MAG: hypothetical protein M3140_10980 [Actinomycetota bacterium]|nr:hypothetical protein [Actinomycetota bacterium]